MTEATLEAQSLLWEWASEACEEDDPEQRTWKVLYAECLVDACEHARLLPADEVVQWRRLLAQGGAPPPAPGDLDAAERHLEELLAAVPPMSREPEPAAVTAGRRFGAALAALDESGVLSDEVAGRWRARGLAAEAPWLAADEIAELSSVEGADAIFAIPIPAASPEEDAADAAAIREIEMAGRRGRATRVFVPDGPQGHDGLAIAAVVTRTESTEVVFHHVGDPQGDVSSGREARAAVRKSLNALVPPSLEDDQWTVYRPVRERPVSSHGSGGPPDPERPRVITGVWRYQPPAPDSAAAFEASTSGARWRLASRSP